MPRKMLDNSGPAHTVLRVRELSGANWDSFEESQKAFRDFNWITDKVSEEKDITCQRRISLLMYCQAVEMTAPHDIMANLLHCLSGKPYQRDPFMHLGRRNKKQLFSWVPPSAKKKFDEIKSLAVAQGHPALEQLISKFFYDHIRNAFSHSDYILTEKHFRFWKGGLAQQIAVGDLDLCIFLAFAFYGAFFDLHHHWLHELAKLPRYHKWPDYEVLELLSTKQEGVYGFKIHFSNGTAASYTQKRDEGVNFSNFSIESEGIGLFCGLRPLESVWKIDGNPVENWDVIKAMRQASEEEDS